MNTRIQIQGEMYIEQVSALHSVSPADQRDMLHQVARMRDAVMSVAIDATGLADVLDADRVEDLAADGASDAEIDHIRRRQVTRFVSEWSALRDATAAMDAHDIGVAACAGQWSCVAAALWQHLRAGWHIYRLRVLALEYQFGVRIDPAAVARRVSYLEMATERARA